MITLTLGTILKNKAPAKIFRPGIYVVRENDRVLYVGKSENSVGSRIQAHCTPRRFSGEMDALGAFVRDCLPDSLSLTVEVLSVAECNQIVKAKARNEREVERLMIRHYRPLLNGTFNT